MILLDVERVQSSPNEKKANFSLHQLYQVTEVTEIRNVSMNLRESGRVVEEGCMCANTHHFQCSAFLYVDPDFHLVVPSSCPKDSLQEHSLISQK